MFDHVIFRSSDFSTTGPAYRSAISVLGAEETWADDVFFEWDDFGIAAVDDDHPPTTGAHVGFVAAEPATVNAFWRAGQDAGLADDGAPGPRTAYGPDYFGGFLRDPDGNSIEACVHERSRPPGVVDHLWLRVRDVRASRDFYVAVSGFTGFSLVVDEPGLARFRGSSASFTLLEDGPPSANVHVAFPADDDAVVRDFHAAALAAGAVDNGGPGGRAVYHPGYYGAFALDPDGNNIEVVNHNRG